MIKQNKNQDSKKQKSLQKIFVEYLQKRLIFAIL
jgi:hypothetical protein